MRVQSTTEVATGKPDATPNVNGVDAKRTVSARSDCQPGTSVVPAAASEAARKDRLDFLSMRRATLDSLQFHGDTL